MSRSYAWHIRSEVSAFLYGPEPYMIAAVLDAEHGGMEEGRTGWRVMSAAYPGLNYLETDVMSMEQMIRAVNVRLGNELKAEIEKLQEDLDNVQMMIFKGEEDDPYVWPEME